jgi:hypothetical protein
MPYTVDTLETLAYDFTGITKDGAKNGEKCQGKGVIPEPSKAEIKKFLESVAKNATESLGRNITPNEVMENPEILQTMIGSVIGAREQTEKDVAKLCKDSPNVADLKELPTRHFNGFTNWLQNELGNPTQRNGGLMQ